MSDCVFEETSESDLLVCVVCGIQQRSPSPPERTRRRCKVDLEAAFPCIHRGGQSRIVSCTICGAVRQEPVFRCAIKNECTLRRYDTRSREGRAMPACIACAEREPTAKPLPPGPPKCSAADVSIIVTARNYSRYLRECLQSCVAQGAGEVWYIDDASTDDSLSVAACVPVKRHFLDKQGGACAGRNFGASLASGKALLFVDGDDVLPPGYLAKLLERFHDGVPFVYSSIQPFDNSGKKWKPWTVPQWGEKSLWTSNFANTSALIDRADFDRVGGWVQWDSMPDWHLFLRLAKLGTPARGDTMLMYRKGHDSWRAQFGRKPQAERDSVMSAIRRDAARVSIGVVYSGRLPGLLDVWLDRLQASVNAVSLPERPQLVVLDNSPDQASRLSEALCRIEGAFSHWRLIDYRDTAPVTDRERSTRGKDVAAFMAGATNRILAETTGDILWLVEDDVLPPVESFGRMHDLLTGGEEPPACVAVTYRSRREPVRLTCGTWRNGRPDHWQQFPTEPTKADYCGTGCTLAWRDRMPAKAEAMAGNAAAHDWAWTLGAKGPLIILPDVARHYQTETVWV